MKRIPNLADVVPLMEKGENWETNPWCFFSTMGPFPWSWRTSRTSDGKIGNHFTVQCHGDGVTVSWTLSIRGKGATPERLTQSVKRLLKAG